LHADRYTMVHLMLNQRTEKDLLTLAEAAERLRLSKQTVRMLIKTGHLPAFKTGEAVNSPIRILRSDLEAWLYSDPDQAA
jgi:excisionase family DNA binding protein